MLQNLLKKRRKRHTTISDDTPLAIWLPDTFYKTALLFESSAYRNEHISYTYYIDVATFNLGSLWFMSMNLGFLLGVNDHRLIIHLFYLQCSHLLSTSITQKWVKK